MRGERLTLWLDALFSHNVDFASKDLGGGCGRVDTVCLDGDDDSTAVLEEVVCVEGNDTCLIGLGNICENDIDHLDEHSVLLGMSSVFNNGNDVGPLFGHTDEISTGSVRELDGVDDTLGTDNVGNVTDGRTGSGTKVKNLASRADLDVSYLSLTSAKRSVAYVDVIETTEDTSGKLTPERIPYSVLDLLLLSLGICRSDRDSLFTIDRLSGGHVSGDEQVLLALGNVDTGVLVGFEGDGTWSSSTESGLSTSTSTTSGCSSSTSGSCLSVLLHER
jgi:hypothetical protein